MVWTHIGTLNDTIVAQSGNQAVSANATSVVIVISQTVATYKITISPSWNTVWWISGKTAAQFQVNFGTPALADGSGSLDWTVNP